MDTLKNTYMLKQNPDCQYPEATNGIFFSSIFLWKISFVWLGSNYACIFYIHMLYLMFIFSVAQMNAYMY